MGEAVTGRVTRREERPALSLVDLLRRNEEKKAEERDRRGKQTARMLEDTAQDVQISESEEALLMLSNSANHDAARVFSLGVETSMNRHRVYQTYHMPFLGIIACRNR